MAARQYSAHDKATAIKIVERFDGEITREALEITREALAAPTLNKSTVYRWVQAARLQPVASELHHEKKAVDEEALDVALDEMFEETARKYLRHALKEDVVASTKSRDAVMNAAVAVDKMRLLRNLPTEVILVLPDLVGAIQDAGLSAGDVFNALLQEIRVHADR
ncbi:MAG: hypothetical protein WCZ87_00270 [Thiohalobacteraceae bacterium]